MTRCRPGGTVRPQVELVEQGDVEVGERAYVGEVVGTLAARMVDQLGALLELVLQ